MIHMKTRFALSTLMLQLLTFTFAFSQSLIAANTEATVLRSQPSNDITINMMEPSYVGGNEALTEYMRNNLQYPEIAKKSGIEGTVILEYYIKEDGTIENVKVVKSVHSCLNSEAIRLVENMPSWNPAIKNGAPARIKYQLPVRFELLF